jgi:hypothetical protein
LGGGTRHHAKVPPLGHSHEREETGWDPPQASQDLREWLREERDNIESTRYEEYARYPEIVKTVPHVAFEVDDLERELEKKKVIIEPNSPDGPHRSDGSQ